jgi:hypothetical protein
MGEVMEDAYIARLARVGAVRPFVSPIAWACSPYHFPKNFRIYQTPAAGVI